MQIPIKNELLRLKVETALWAGDVAVVDIHSRIAMLEFGMAAEVKTL